MADKAYITPNVLRWARESARISEETAANKISVSVDKIKEWESGTSQPTIRQAQTLAKAYRRPFAVFFLPDIPRDFQPLQDFRRKSAKSLGTASVFIIREIQQKQAWVSEINEENHEPQIPFVGKFSLQDDPANVAQDILRTFDIIPNAYHSNNPIKEWIDKAELRGIFISRTSFIHSKLKLDSEEIQGFAIADPYAPFVFINAEDWTTAQLFTLVHELAHIWIAASGISNEIDSSSLNDYDKLHPVELFCNQVAASALMPSDIIRNMSSLALNSSKEVFKVARKFGVSSFAFLVRALHLDLISLNKYRQLKHEAEIEYEAFVRRKEEKNIHQQGGPNYYLLQLNKNSRLFTQTVLDAFRGGVIEPTQASGLLNVQVNKFPKLEAQLHK